MKILIPRRKLTLPRSGIKAPGALTRVIAETHLPMYDPHVELERLQLSRLEGRRSGRALR